MQRIIPFFLLALFTISIQSCYKDEGICSDSFYGSPYSNPIWHPGGQILGFNRQPVKSGGRDRSSCSGFGYSYYSDSSGFWLIDKDGSNLRRATSYQLLYASWSPDGKWLLFSSYYHRGMMAFDGYNLDTAHIKDITFGSNPAWNLSGDTVYYDFYPAVQGKSFQIYKLAVNGGSPILIGDKGIDSIMDRQPFYTNDNQILHIRYTNSYQDQIFLMDLNGNNVTQITYDTLANGELPGDYNYFKDYPKSYNNKIYYQSNGIYTVNLNGSGRVKLCSASNENFSISKDGTIAYVLFDYHQIDRTYGVIWLMDNDGKNKRQLTHNYF